MKTGIRSLIAMGFAAAVLNGAPMAVQADPAVEDIFSYVEEAQVKPIRDGSGKYILKSDGFYCLNENGTKETAPAVHYFDHIEIDGTVLNGFYYHDETGRFAAGNAHIVSLKEITYIKEDSGERFVFDGLYMVNNLGRLSASPQVRYISGLTVDKAVYEGYYYFNEYGRMITEPGFHELDMSSNAQRFCGTYYFGGENGVLLQEAGITPEGLPIDETGKVSGTEELGMESLKPQLESMLAGYDGTWSVYVKNMNTREEILLNNTPLYSASLIKAFVMASVYENMEEVLEHEAKLLKVEADSDKAKTKIQDLLWNMITVSDNESCNELGRLHSEKHDFLEGAELVNAFIQKEGYTDTLYQSTLHPSASPKLSLGQHNTTTVKDCGKLLEKIYFKKCVSRKASEEMLELLMNQKNTAKIPFGINAEVSIANKTGETDADQHDMAIVYGPKTDYILCVMSQDFKNGNTAIENIRKISAVVYYYLNL